MEILVLALLIGIIPAAIANSKGHSFLGWWLFGAALFILALPLAILLKPETSTIENRQLSAGDSQKCPYCAEIIKREAIVCRFCGRDLVPTNLALLAEPSVTALEFTQQDVERYAGNTPYENVVLARTFIKNNNCRAAAAALTNAIQQSEAKHGQIYQDAVALLQSIQTVQPTLVARMAHPNPDTEATT